MRERMIYQTDDTRRAILSAARELFTGHGLFQIQMKDIALKAGVSRNTLYRYYRDKSELALAILTELLDGILSRELAAAASENAVLEGGVGCRPPASGWSRLKRVFTRVWVESGFSDELKFMAEFDAYYAGERLPPELVAKLQAAAGQAVDEALLGIAREGYADGSIRADAAGGDPHLLTVTLLNAVRALKQRLTLRGEGLVEATRDERLVMVETLIETLFEGIRGGKR